jgi:hypothetical protein
MFVITDFQKNIMYTMCQHVYDLQTKFHKMKNVDISVTTTLIG